MSSASLVTTPVFFSSTQSGTDVRTITIDTNDSIILDNRQTWYCRLHSLSFPYSFQTVNESNNKMLIRRFPADPWEEIVFPPGGYYTVDDYNDYLKKWFDNEHPDWITADEGCCIKQYPVQLYSDISLQKVVLRIDNNNSSNTSDRYGVDMNPTNQGIGKDLGFTNPSIIQSVDPVLDTISNSPVIMDDVFASGILCRAGGDLKVYSYKDNNQNSDILAHAYIDSGSRPGGQVLFPSNGISTLAVPVIGSYQISTIILRWISPRDGSDIVFQQGTLSGVLEFVVL